MWELVNSPCWIETLKQSSMMGMELVIHDPFSLFFIAIRTVAHTVV